MERSRTISIGGCLAALLVAGCSGGGVSPGSTTNLPTVNALRSPITVDAKHGHRAKSCRTTKCIYVAVYEYGSAGSVNVYPGSADGDVAPIWTINGPKTKMRRIRGLDVDANRNVYVVDTDSILVYAAGAHGNVAPVRTITGSNTGLDFPSDVAVDARGVIYVVNDDDDYSKYSVTVYPAGANGNVAPIQTISGSETTLFLPTGIALDGQKNIYVLNSGGSGASVFAAGANGNVAPVRIVRSSKWITQPYAIAVSAQGAMQVGNVSWCYLGSCYGTNAVLRFPAGADGEVNHIKKIMGLKTRLMNIQAIALGPEGRTYVADGYSLSIFVYSAGAHGNVGPNQTVFGSGTGFDAYPGPIGIAVR